MTQSMKVSSKLYHEGKVINLPPSDWMGFIRGKSYSAIIFDCDGTLVESSEVHFRSFLSAAKAQGFELDRDWYYDRTGLDRNSLFEAFSEAFAPEFDIAEACVNSISYFVEHSDLVQPIALVQNLVIDLAGSYALAVATNAERQVAKASLKSVDLWDQFSILVSVSDGVPPKPAPDMFLKAAELLHTPINQALVFEDSNEGVKAALNAGMDVIQVKIEHQEEK